METPYRDYEYLVKKPSFFMLSFAKDYLGKSDANLMAKCIVENYKGEELVRYLSDLIIQAYIQIKEAQRGTRKSVDINVHINSDGMTAKVEEQ